MGRLNRSVLIATGVATAFVLGLGVSAARASEPSWKDRPVSVGEPLVAEPAALPTMRIDAPPAPKAAVKEQKLRVKTAQTRAKKHKKARSRRAALPVGRR
jgi:hypothetical protein